MTIDARLLTLTQMFSPAFPVGAFAYSHGLETAISDGRIRDAASLEAWLTDLLEQGSGRADAVLLVNAARSQTPDESEEVARAFAASAERLHETVVQGQAFCDAIAATWGLPLKALTYPVAVGWAAREMALPLPEVTAHYLQAFAANLISAAVRFVPLGQSDGQRVQAALQPLILSVAAEVQSSTLDDLFSNSFLSDVAAMRHETLTTRTFRT